MKDFTNIKNGDRLFDKTDNTIITVKCNKDNDMFLCSDDLAYPISEFNPDCFIKL